MPYRRLRQACRSLTPLMAMLVALVAVDAPATPEFEASYREFPVDIEAVSLAYGDFDEDGLTDVVVATASAAIDLVLMRQNPDHTFTAQGGWATTDLLQHMVAGDFNGDDHLDVAGIDFGGDLTVYFGDGYGGGGASVSRPAPAGALYLAVADLGTDTTDDLVVVSYLNRTLQTYNSAGSLLTPGTPYTTLVEPSGLGVGDLNNDGVDDFVLAHETLAVAEVLYTNASGGVATAQSVPLGTLAGSAAAILDVNGDGRKDVLIGLSDGSGVAVCSSNGAGAFSSPDFYGAAPGSSNFAVLGGDLDGDGDTDLVLGGPESRVLLNIGSGAFNTVGPALPPYVHGFTDLYLTDLDGDTRRDVLAYGNYGAGLLVAFGNGDGTFGGGQRLATGFADALILADLDGDDDADAVTVNGFVNALQTYARSGDTFGAPVSYALADLPMGLAQGRFDAGSTPDFATTLPAAGQILVFPGDGAGQLTGPLTLTTSEYPIGVAAGDLNADGRDDLVVVCSEGEPAAAAGAKAEALGNHGFLVYLSSGAGFAAPTFVGAAGTCPVGVTIADVTGDGRPDLLAPLSCTDQVRLYAGLGAGAFAAGTVVTSLPQPSAVVARDLDGDGDRDLVVLGANGDLRVVPGLGGGAFGAPQTVETALMGQRLVIADLDLDGRLDVAVLSAASLVAMHPGLPGGTFGPRQDLGVTSYPMDLVANDFDGDGDTDLLVPNGSLEAFDLLVNRRDPQSAAPDVDVALTGGLDLRSPVPNPASGLTRFEYRLGAAARVSVEVFDVRGHHVRTLVAGSDLPAGTHAARWELTRDDGTPVPAGVYFARVRAGGLEATRKIFVTR